MLLREYRGLQVHMTRTHFGCALIAGVDAGYGDEAGPDGAGFIVSDHDGGRDPVESYTASAAVYVGLGHESARGLVAALVRRIEWGDRGPEPREVWLVNDQSGLRSKNPEDHSGMNGAVLINAASKAATVRGREKYRRPNGAPGTLPGGWREVPATSLTASVQKTLAAACERVEALYGQGGDVFFLPYDAPVEEGAENLEVLEVLDASN